MSTSPRAGGEEEEFDRRFAEIVSRYDEATPPEAPPPLPAEDPRPAAVDPPAQSWRGWDGPEDDDDHFVPPPPEPLPAGDLHFWAIVTGLVAGPLLVLLSGGLNLLGRGWGWLGIVLSVAGFVLLVLRQPRSRDGDDPSGGARV